MAAAEQMPLPKAPAYVPYVAKKAPASCGRTGRNPV